MGQVHNYKLRIRNALQDESFSLVEGKQYVVGRSDLAEVVLKDNKASSKHALIFFENGKWRIKDNNSTNGIYLAKRRVDMAELSGGTTLRVGATIIGIIGSDESRKEPIARRLRKENVQSEKDTKSRPAWGIPAICGALSLLVFLGGIFVLFPEREHKNTSSTAEELLLTQPEESTKSEVTWSQPEPAESENDYQVSNSDKDLAREYYRAGLRSRDNGHLKRAIESWDLARAYDPTNSLVIKKLAQALEELDREIGVHYKLGKSHLKYLKYHEAEQEFMIVTELCQDKSDERYIDSLQKIQDIKRRLGKK